MKIAQHFSAGTLKAGYTGAKRRRFYPLGWLGPGTVFPHKREPVGAAERRFALSLSLPRPPPSMNPVIKVQQKGQRI